MSISDIFWRAVPRKRLQCIGCTIEIVWIASACSSLLFATVCYLIQPLLKIIEVMVVQVIQASTTVVARVIPVKPLQNLRFVGGLRQAFIQVAASLDILFFWRATPCSNGSRSYLDLCKFNMLWGEINNNFKTFL